jgi:hypothetical protein
MCRPLGQVLNLGAVLALGVVLAAGVFVADGQCAAFAMQPEPSLDAPPALLSLPANAQGESGATVQVPIGVSPGDGILGVDMTVTYDPAVLQAQNVVPWGVAATAGFALVANLNTPGVILVSAYATGEPLSGSGDFARIQFQVLGRPGASSALVFTSATINEGEIPATLHNGVFTAVATTTVLSMPGNAQGGSGATVQIPISATPADGIFGIDLTVHYDAAVLHAESVAVSGIAAATGFAVAANLNTPGVVVISTYATTNPLAGSGEILRITFTVLGSPGALSSLAFASASINEGAIPVGFSPGLFTVNCVGAADGVRCNDGNPATCVDVCSGGVCAGTPVAEPAEVNASLRVSASGSDANLAWDDLPGPFNVYRGTIAGGAPFIYNQGCFTTAGPIPVQAATDSLTPPLGTVFYYLVTRVDQCRESIPGRDSAGTPIPNPNACPVSGG